MEYFRQSATGKKNVYTTDRTNKTGEYAQHESGIGLCSMLGNINDKETRTRTAYNCNEHNIETLTHYYSKSIFDLKETIITFVR